MQNILSLFLAFGLWSCQSTEQNHGQKSDLVLAAEFLELNLVEGLMYADGVLFTGIAQKKNSTGSLIMEAHYQNGKKHGLYRMWFENGDLSYQADYKHGKRHGTVKSWWQNGLQRSESNYDMGVAHGMQKQWYNSGQLFKEINLVNGKEEGLQRAWRENGVLYTNYEAKNGRIFGLKRATLCYQLEDEYVQFD